MEQVLISELNSHDDDFGYNMTMGGLKIIPNKALTNKKREATKGKNAYWYGKKRSDETRARISLNHRDCSGSNNPQARRVYQFTIGGEFIKSYDSIKDASDETGSNRQGISYASNHSKVANGFLWTYEDNIVLVDGITKLREYKYKRGSTAKEIYKFDSNGEYIAKYKSVIEASNNNKELRRGSISSCAKDKTVYKGIKWRYKDDVIEVDDTFKIKEE